LPAAAWQEFRLPAASPCRCGVTIALCWVLSLRAFVRLGADVALIGAVVRLIFNANRYRCHFPVT
jgi:hypothetical protein